MLRPARSPSVPTGRPPPERAVAEMDDEIRFHIDMRVAQLVARGWVAKRRDCRSAAAVRSLPRDAPEPARRGASPRGDPDDGRQARCAATRQSVRATPDRARPGPRRRSSRHSAWGSARTRRCSASSIDCCSARRRYVRAPKSSSRRAPTQMQGEEFTSSGILVSVVPRFPRQDLRLHQRRHADVLEPIVARARADARRRSPA